MSDPAPSALHVTRRLYEIEGEARLNLLRLAAVALFFTLHVVNRTFVGLGPGAMIDLDDGGQVPIFDAVATALVVAWTGAAGALLLVLRSPRLPRAVGPLLTLLDAALLSILIFIGNGPTSPLIYVLFLLIAATGLRGRRGDVWLATLASLGVYAASVGIVTQTNADLLPPMHHLLFVSAGLGMMGLVTDLLVGSSWKLAERYATILDRVRAIEPDALSHDRPWDCPWCETHNAPLARRCIRCDEPLVAGEPLHAVADRSGSRRASAMLVWTGGVILIVFVSLVLLVSLALTWPALTVPFAGVVGVLVLGLARIVHLDLRGNADDEVLGRTANALGLLAGTVALSATMLTLLLFVAVLMSAAAGLIAVAFCFAVVLGAGAAA